MTLPPHTPRGPRPAVSSLQLVPSPRGLRALARALGLALGVAAAALVVVPWQQNVPASGRVAAFAPFDRVQTIAAPVAGRVRQAWVAEGSRVEAGDPLLEIVDNDPSILERLDAQRAALESQLAAAEERVSVFASQVDALERARSLAVEAATSQLDVATTSIRSARHAIAAARAAAAQAELDFARKRELVEGGLVSGLEFELAERAHREASARVEQARESLAAAENDARARRADLGRIDTEAAAGVASARASREAALADAAGLRQRIADLATRIARQETQLVTAPRAGTVVRLLAAPGAELVEAGAPLVSLVPDAERVAVELWVDGNDVPLVHEGRRVRLQFEGFPAVQFAGWPSVAIGTFGGRVALVDSVDDGRGRFRLLVVPDEDEPAWPDARFLRQGMRANGFVLLDRVRLGYELWRRANAFPPVLAMEPSAEARGS
ncbi:MAG: HlyD family efflux transporter periplasmic adaptor subunit [Myxococcota bacterium]